MLEGLEISEIAWSKVLTCAVTMRLDSDYYSKASLAYDAIIAEQSVRFRKFAEMGLQIDGSAFYPSIELFYGQGNLPFLRVADVDSVIDFHGCTTIPEELCVRFPTLKRVRKGDIVLTKGGSIARLGFVSQDAAACRDLIFINSSRLPEEDQVFLYLYLQTRMANHLLLRSGSQTAQPHLTLTLVKDLPLLQASGGFRRACLRTVKQAYAVRDQSHSLYAAAERTLLAALGLADWQPSEPLTYVRRAADAMAAGRMDAEYFRPRYVALLEKLRTAGAVRLGDCLAEPIHRGASPEYTESGEYTVINSQHVGKTHVELRDNRFTSAAFVDDGNNARAVVRRHDVLLNSTGYITIGRCQALLDDARAIVDNHVAIIRPTSELDPVYLACFLNALPGQWQSERGWTGSSGQIELRPDVIADYLVWKAPSTVQREIRNMVENAHVARHESAAMLSRAKRAVEIAIEEDESAALRYLRG